MTQQATTENTEVCSEVTRPRLTEPLRCSSSAAVILLHSGFERHGPEWRSMRDGVSGASNWNSIVQGYTALASETSPTVRAT
jgi:hypothetical protein